MSLRPPEKAQKLQAALHAKAKGSPTYRFYALYDKVYRKDILLFAYRCCKANGGAPGVDGQDFVDIETYGLELWLGELAEELRSKTYRPQAVRRVLSPKSGHRHPPVAKEDPANLSRDQRDDQPTLDAHGGCRPGRPTEPHVGRLGELLLFGSCEQSPPGS